MDEIKFKEIQDDFLARGGVLLRKGINEQGEPIIQHKKQGLDWSTRLTFTKEGFRNKTFEFLLTDNQFFRSDDKSENGQESLPGIPEPPLA